MGFGRRKSCNERIYDEADVLILVKLLIKKKFRRRFFRRVQTSVQKCALNDFSIRRSSYHFKGQEYKNMRAFDFLIIEQKYV